MQAILKIISLFVALIAIALITAYLYDFLTPPRISNSGYIKVWIAGEMKVSKTIEDPQLISEFQFHWNNKETVDMSKNINFDYLIDGIVEERLQYASTGYIKVLSVLNTVPIYKLEDPESFNNLILSGAE
jgi:hypothetical protein